MLNTLSKPEQRQHLRKTYGAELAFNYLISTEVESLDPILSVGVKLPKRPSSIKKMQKFYGCVRAAMKDMKQPKEFILRLPNYKNSAISDVSGLRGEDRGIFVKLCLEHGGHYIEGVCTPNKSEQSLLLVPETIASLVWACCPSPTVTEQEAGQVYKTNLDRTGCQRSGYKRIVHKDEDQSAFFTKLNADLKARFELRDETGAEVSLLMKGIGTGLIRDSHVEMTGAGRIYGKHQTLSKKQRDKLRLKDFVTGRSSPVTTFDIVSSHTAISYIKAGLPMTEQQAAAAYNVQIDMNGKTVDVPRDITKMFAGVMYCAKLVVAAVVSDIEKTISFKSIFKECESEESFQIAARTFSPKNAGIRQWFEFTTGLTMPQVAQKILDGEDPRNLIDRSVAKKVFAALKEKHSKINHLFATSDTIGLQMMSIEGNLGRIVTRLMLDRGMWCGSLHDGFLVCQKDTAAFHECFNEAATALGLVGIVYREERAGDKLDFFVAKSSEVSDTTKNILSLFEKMPELKVRKATPKQKASIEEREKQEQRLEQEAEQALPMPQKPQHQLEEDVLVPVLPTTEQKIRIEENEKRIKEAKEAQKSAAMDFTPTSKTLISQLLDELED